MRESHVLEVLKFEVDNFFDLEDDYHLQHFLFAKPIAKAIEKVFLCNRCGFSVIGLEAPHAYLHLIPINTANDLNFTQPKLNLAEAQLKKRSRRF